MYDKATPVSEGDRLNLVPTTSSATANTSSDPKKSNRTLSHRCVAMLSQYALKDKVSPISYGTMMKKHTGFLRQSFGHFLLQTSLQRRKL